MDPPENLLASHPPAADAVVAALEAAELAAAAATATLADACIIEERRKIEGRW